jgi:integrase
LLLFTGCRLREILHLRWEHVDFERGCLFLPDSKSGRKTVILNAPALAVLNELERFGPYVVPGDDPEQPRHDLKRPWDAVTKRAGLPASAYTICDTLTRASVRVAGWACRSSVDCWAMPKQRLPPATHISTMIRFEEHQNRLGDELPPH